MTPNELREETSIELEWMQSVIDEIQSLREELSSQPPSVREKAAAASFLAQFYNGVENILTRISRFHNINFARSESWHIDLFQRFCNPPLAPLPQLFDTELAIELSQFRRFRHVVMHSYGFQIE